MATRRRRATEREQFEDAWERYAPEEPPLLPSHRHNPHGYPENSPSAAGTCDGNDMPANPHGSTDVTVLRLDVGFGREDTSGGWD